MFLTNHAALGIIIGQHISHPAWVIFLSLLSHFLLDIIPHGDSKLESQMKLKNIILIALADLVILSLMLLILIASGTINIFNPNILLGIFFTMLPDGLQLIYFLSNKKLLVRYKQFHTDIHNYFAQKFDFSLTGGIVLQIFFAGIFYFLIYHFAV